jgi:AraC-like DNA-binding protein
VDVAEQRETVVVCGFGSPETMRRAFLRVLGVGPSDYRARFRSTSLSRSAGVV